MGALIGGGLALGTAALGAYSAYASSQQQKAALGGLANQGYSAPDYGGTIDYLGNNWNTPQYQDYTPTSYDTGYQQYLQGGKKYGNRISNFLEKTNDKSNRQYRSDLFKTSPTLRGNIAQQGATTSQFLRGEIPADVQAQVQNHAAETSLFGGFGGSQMGRNLVARDFGMTSLDMINRGNSGLAQQLGYSQQLNPYESNTLDYLGNPQQLQQTAVQQNQFGNGVYNSNRTNSANIANQRATMIANLMRAQAEGDAGATNTNNVLQYNANMAPNPLTSAVATGAGSLAASYGGGGGGAGGGGSNYSGLINLLSGLAGGGGGSPQTSQYGGTYQGTFNNSPVYRPQGYA